MPRQFTAETNQHYTPDPEAGPAPASGRLLSGRDPRLVLADAREALERGEWAESAHGFQELLLVPGYAAEARYGLGWIELQQGATDRAHALFREATEADSGHANSWFARGRVTEGTSVDDAIECYQHALTANPDHYGAAERLRLLHEPKAAAPSIHARTLNPAAEPAAATGAPQTHATAGALETHAAPGWPELASLPEPGDLGVVEYLQQDNSPVAKDALARIESLNRSGHFRVSAHLQRILTRFALLFVPAVILAYILYHVTPLTIGGTTFHFYNGNSTELILGAVALWALWTAWTLLDCTTNTVTIRNARIKWTHGVLNKHTETLDVWTARDVEFDQNLLQRVTDDGTLTCRGTTHDRPRRFRKGQLKPLSLTGIATAGELEDIYAMLLDLKFLLRAHPGLKGIIQ